MHLFCDESGNTGLDLLDSQQPVFSLASTALSGDAALDLVQPLLRPRQIEVKYSNFKGSRAGQQELLKFFSSPSLLSEYRLGRCLPLIRIRD
jgi:hypothetical protein